MDHRWIAICSVDYCFHCQNGIVFLWHSVKDDFFTMNNFAGRISMGSTRLIRVFAMIVGAVIVVCIILFVLHSVGYDLRIVHRFSEIGIPSSDGEYFLVEMSDATGKLLVYSVVCIDNGEYPQILYVTDDFWYHSRFIEGYGWIEATNNFYIDSSDSGMHRYFFNGDTWMPEY